MLQKDKNNLEIAMQIRYHEMLSRKTADNFMLGFRLSKADSVELVAVAISGTSIGDRAKYWLSFFYPTYTFNSKVKAYQLPDYSKIDCFEAARKENMNNGLHDALLSAIPNPAIDMVTIHYKLINEDKVAFIEILDIVGTKVLIRTIISTQSTDMVFNISNLASGAYLYRLIKDNNIIGTKKLIIVK